MKNLILKYSLIALIGLGIYACGSSKDSMPQIENNPPFIIEEAYFQSWVSGVRGGGSGVNVFLNFKEIDTSKVKIDSLYFKQRITALEFKNERYIAKFKGERNQQNQFILHRDSKKEYGNKPPTVKEYYFPFQLNENEAIISYLYKEKMFYYKLELTQKEAELYE